MTKYTTRHINIASLLITIIIFFITQQYKTPTIPMNTQKIEKLFKKDLILVELKSNNINQDTKENEKDTQNFGLTEEEKNIEIKGSYIDLILGKEAEILNIMKPYGVYVLKKNK